MDPTQLNEFAIRYTAAWCSQSAGSVAAFFEEQGSLAINDGAPAIGRRAITDSVQSFMTAFPDLQVEMNRLDVRETGTRYHWTLTGTHTGPGGTGRRVRLTGHEEWRFGNDELILASSGHFDAADYERQLHATGSSGIEDKLRALGLALPPPPQPPPGVILPFQFVRVVGHRALISGHGPQNPDGSLALPLGKLGRDLTVEQGYAAARMTGLSVLGSLERTLGNLDRVAAWTRVFGMVNSAPGFCNQPSVINGFSDLILELFGPVRGAHCRSAVGMAELPFNIPVEIEGEVELV